MLVGVVCRRNRIFFFLISACAATESDTSRCDAMRYRSVVRNCTLVVSRALASYCEPAKFERVIVVHVSHIQILS